VLFGGQAGGGKTDALLMAALQYVDIPGYAALLLRRTFRQLMLEESLMDRAGDWLSGTDARWRASDNRWTFPSGATLTFGYLDRDQDKYNYQSAAYQMVGWDELTQWPKDGPYRYMFSRLRRLDNAEMAVVPLRMRATTNPGGLGHDWVKTRWNLGTSDVERPPLPSSRLFLRSALSDNPYLEQESYLEGLSELGALDLAHLVDGDWDARPSGTMLQRPWFQLVEDVPARLKLCRYWDLAATEPHEGNTDPDWTVGALVGLDEEFGDWYIIDVVRHRLNSAASDQVMRQTAIVDRQKYGPVRQRVEQEPGSSGKKVIDDLRTRVFVGSDFQGHAPTGDKVTRARPLAAAAGARKVHMLIRDWSDALLTEFEQFPSKGVHDDQVDAVTGAMAELAFGHAGRGGMRS
jgi:predicted phage terminase large subunit-like protein